MSEGPVVVLGGAGLLGRAVRRALDARGLPWVAPSRVDLDLERPEKIGPFLREAAPRAVVNAAAFTDVAGCELARNRAARDLLNRDAPAEVARACGAGGLPLAWVSTDYVFDGAKGAPYVEDDPVNPLQAYGASKLEGERAVSAAWPGALIVRTSTLYGPGPRSRPHYVDAILDQARRRPVVSVARPPVSSPTLSGDLAEAILALLAAGATGLVHVVNAGACSRLELAREAVRLAGLDGRSEVRERTEPQRPPARPPYSVLDTGRFSRIVGRDMRAWHLALADYVERA